MLGPLAMNGDLAAHDQRFIGPEQIVAWNDNATLAHRIPRQWLQIRGRIGTACVTGDDRIGKSTLLTLWGRMLLRSEGFDFPAGHNRTSFTRGLWSAMFLAESTGLSYHLNLCDSQGLKQVTEVEGQRLFSANVLVPSVLVYMVINVVQNDQLRDLASMAHQFQKLTADEANHFHSFLSPHLIVVVREDSDLYGDEPDTDISHHLEEVLRSPGYTDDKELIRRVFQTREAWSLRELPREARRELRAGANGSIPPLVTGRVATAAAEWRTSGEAVLWRVIAALGRKQEEFPHGGVELAEWYRSVLATVNNDQDWSMGFLVRHSERLALGRRRQQLLREWFTPVLVVLACLALLLTSGCLGLWLDRATWCAWVMFCTCYVGTSPAVTMPLSGLVPQYCQEHFPSVGDVFMKTLCREASTHTAAILLAVLFGLLTYPMLKAYAQWVFRLTPRTGVLLRAGAAAVPALAAGGLGLLHRASVDATIHCSADAVLSAAAILGLSVVITGVEFVVSLRRNCSRARASERGRALHFYVVARIEEVRALTATREWAEHYERHRPRDALWQLRHVPVWWSLVKLSQACALLAWAMLIHPHSDLILAVGVAANLVHTVWRTLTIVVRAGGRRSTAAECHEDAASAASDSEEGAGCPGAAPPADPPEKEKVPAAHEG